MSVVIRLSRVGKRGIQANRIVAIEKKSKREGIPVETLGSYSLDKTDGKVKINKERVKYWQSVGATISPAVEKLLKEK